MVDLHIHSQYSDGTYTVEHIFKTAAKKGIEHISITDHNKLDAYILEDIETLKDMYGVKITTGVEMDCMASGEYTHILGYGIDVKNKAIKRLIDSIFEESLKVDVETIKAMQKDCKNISAEEFADYSFDRSNGGWLFINYVKDKGLTESLLDGTRFYRKYPVNLNKTLHDLNEVCEAVHSAGGIAVYAHPPYSLENEVATVLANMQKAVNTGIDGIECYHPLIDDNMSRELIKFCDSHSLYITSGGDSHGSFLDENKYYIGGQPHNKIRFI